MASAKDDAPRFYHKPALQIIKDIEKLNHGKLHKNGHSLKANARMKPSGKQFEIKITSDMFSEKRKGLEFGKEPRKVHFKSKTQSLILEKLFFGHRSTNLIAGSTHSFYTEGYSKTKKYWYRLIIPLENKLDFHYTIQQKRFISDLGYSAWSGLASTIHGDDFFAQVIHDPANNYFLAIHSDQRQSFQIFSEKAFAVKNAMGYLTGHLAGNKGYFFAYSSATLDIPVHFHFSSFRDTIASYYSPVSSNPYTWVSIPRKTAQKLYRSNTILPVPAPVFSALCQKLYDSVEFTSVIMLILESSIATLLFMPGGFAIALETLSKIIMAESKKKSLAPVDKVIMQTIVKTCKDIIDAYDTDIDEPTRSMLKHRIEQINQPTNKAKLRIPFDLLKQKLNAKDLEILESRNDFLHGQIPDLTKAGDKRTLARKNKDMYYASLRFYTLLNRLILKWVGFDGFILNQNKIHGKQLKIKLNEPYYIKL